MFLVRGRRLFTLATLLPVLVAIILPAVASVSVCRYGMVMDADACCPKPADRDRDPGARLEDAPCCAKQAVAFDRLISERSTRIDHIPLSRVAASVVSLAPAWPAASPRLLPRLSPPPIGPPVRLIKQSFLL
jgi:hypothetical protein